MVIGVPDCGLIIISSGTLTRPISGILHYIVQM